MNTMHPSLDPRKQELLEARFLGNPRVSVRMVRVLGNLVCVKVRERFVNAAS